MPNFVTRILRKGKNKKIGDGNTGDTSKISVGEGVGPLETFDYCDGSASGTDLVFVHGLRGSRLKTWSSGDVFWPRDLLKNDVKNSRVITWGYDASVANAFSYASKESIFGHAETLLSDLARLRKGIVYPPNLLCRKRTTNRGRQTRSIVFICHSLGGLVVKEALITSALYNKHKEQPTLGEIYASTIGVIFFGTPHRGSSQESLAEVATNVAKISLRQPNKQLLATLSQESHILEIQRERFRTISSNLKIVCISEELPTGLGLV
jgi:protein SERAC1